MSTNRHCIASYYRQTDTKIISLEREQRRCGLHCEGRNSPCPSICFGATSFGPLCDTFDTSKPVPSANWRDPDIFQIILEHAYGRYISNSSRKEHAKDILHASVKYGFNKLWSEAESRFIDSLSVDINVNNAIEQLIFADSNNFTKLRRAMKNFIISDGQVILASEPDMTFEAYARCSLLTNVFWCFELQTFWMAFVRSVTIKTARRS